MLIRSVDGDGGVIESERERRAVKISTGENVAVIGENEWVVGRRAGFDRENFFAMGERAADRAVHLRHAAQAVGILHARIVLRVRRADFALAKQGEEMTRHRHLRGMRARLMDARVERDRCALKRFERHRAGHIGDAREALGAEKREAADGVHRLGAIEKGEAFLGVELDRLETGAGRARPHPACVALRKTLRLPRSR